MAGPECIIFAFAAFSEAAYPAFFPVLSEDFTSSRKYFVRIGLVAYIENDLVFRSIVDIVQTYDKFYGSET